MTYQLCDSFEGRQEHLLLREFCGSETIWGGDNVGRRFERCATKNYAYDNWINDTLDLTCEAHQEVQ